MRWAEHTEKPNGSGLNEAEARKIFDTGYAMGVQDAENKQHGANDFRTTDGKPEWNDVALFLQRNKARLDAKHHEFIDDMASSDRVGARADRASAQVFAQPLLQAGREDHVMTAQPQTGMPNEARCRARL